jgi:RNA polymerase sigma factor (sigma-70 family)
MSGSHRNDGEARPSDDAQPTLTKELLARYLAGDFAAEERLFSRFRTALLERARRHPRLRPLARDCTAEDVVQEVFRRALASGMLRDFEDRGRGSLEAVLTRVLENTLVDFGRRASARKRGGTHERVDALETGLAPGLDRLPAEDTTPTSRARSNELVELAGRVLEPRELEAWRPVEIEGLDAADVAHRMESTPAAIRGLVYRARAKLMRALSDERGESDSRSRG